MYLILPLTPRWHCGQWGQLSVATGPLKKKTQLTHIVLVKKQMLIIHQSDIYSGKYGVFIKQNN